MSLDWIWAKEHPSANRNDLDHGEAPLSLAGSFCSSLIQEAEAFWDRRPFPHSGQEPPREAEELHLGGRTCKEHTHTQRRAETRLCPRSPLRPQAGATPDGQWPH